MYASELPAWLVRFMAFVFGATWGSFFNVCIYRWPRHMSVVSPPSHCPACGAPIQAWRNVPIFGYLFLRGKASCCGAPMTPRYVLVELLGALLCVGLAERFVVNAVPGAELTPAALTTLAYFMFAGGLLVATFIDLEWLIIPDEVSLPGAGVGLLVAGNEMGIVSAQDAALGAAMGFLFVQLVFVWAYERVTGRRGMGEGDPKLLMMIGAFLGWKGVLFAVVAGSMQGLIAAAVSYVSGGTLLPPPRPDPMDGWPREDLLGYLKDLFGRRPELLAEEEAMMRIGFGMPEAGAGAGTGTGTGTGAESEAEAQSESESETQSEAETQSETETEAQSETETEAQSETEAEAEAETETETQSETEAEAETETDAPSEGARMMIPFGPFLALGALEFLFFGERLIDAYFGLFEG